jgi:hypothetical protein
MRNASRHSVRGARLEFALERHDRHADHLEQPRRQRRHSSTELRGLHAVGCAHRQLPPPLEHQRDQQLHSLPGANTGALFAMLAA